jgi:MoxR-like ATPase
MPPDYRVPILVLPKFDDEPPPPKPRPREPLEPLPEPPDPVHALEAFEDGYEIPRWFVNLPWHNDLRFALLRCQGAILKGPPGSGKTLAAHVVSRKLNGILVSVQSSRDSNREDLIGSYELCTGTSGSFTRFIAGPLTQAVSLSQRFPDRLVALLVEEFNTWQEGMLALLHTLIDGSKDGLRANGRRFVPGPGFRLLLTMNPDAVGTREVSEALIDRLLVIDAPQMDPDTEANILVLATGISVVLARRIAAVMACIRESNQVRPSIRTALRMIDYRRTLSAQGLPVTWTEAFERCVVAQIGHSADDDRREALRKIAANIPENPSTWPSPDDHSPDPETPQPPF